MNINYLMNFGRGLKKRKEKKKERKRVMSRLPFEYEIENTEPMKYEHLFLTYEEMYNKFPKEGSLIEEITLNFMFGDGLADLARKFENHTRWHLYGIKDERQVNAIFGRVML